MVNEKCLNYVRLLIEFGPALTCTFFGMDVLIILKDVTCCVFTSYTCPLQCLIRAYVCFVGRFVHDTGH